MKLSLLHCHYAPREARGIAGHKDCWPPEEDRTLVQLVAAACPSRDQHAPRTTNTRCSDCGLYFGEES